MNQNNKNLGYVLGVKYANLRRGGGQRNRNSNLNLNPAALGFSGRNNNRQNADLFERYSDTYPNLESGYLTRRFPLQANHRANNSGPTQPTPNAQPAATQAPRPQSTNTVPNIPAALSFDSTFVDASGHAWGIPTGGNYANRVRISNDDLDTHEMQNRVEMQGTPVMRTHSGEEPGRASTPPQPRVEGSYEDAQGLTVELLSDGTQRFKKTAALGEVHPGVWAAGIAGGSLLSAVKRMLIKSKTDRMAGRSEWERAGHGATHGLARGIGAVGGALAGHALVGASPFLGARGVSTFSQPVGAIAGGILGYKGLGALSGYLQDNKVWDDYYRTQTAAGSELNHRDKEDEEHKRFMKFITELEKVKGGGNVVSPQVSAV